MFRPVTRLLRSRPLAVATVGLALVLGPMAGSAAAVTATATAATTTTTAAFTTTAAADGDASSTGPTAAAAYTGSATSANARFVVASYQTLLGRDPETAGLDFHVARLVSGGAPTRLAITYSLLFSPEGSAREVERAYADLLDRSPDPSGRAYWTAHLQGFGVLDLRVLLLSSDEYRNRAGGTDQAWIEALYQDLLGRAADPSGLEHWLGRAGAAVPRPLIVAGIHQSDEALGRRADAYHQEVLARAPSGAERATAIATIRRTGERGLRAQLLASDEAFETHLQAALS